ncbi:3-phosphoshikimate 1-carboxyvinyltransferase [Hathewaya histolytica]|uniref:3-phosphoshikimate 1-carboxyvinyltransferase n=1 Tax=Hathewaya histolytica TaxID=1498 RepID=A0A4U9R1P2_HATHI|nr:3-phosphoshikimate 1-carboxyvinyltransferase [Hathewaya histolytica]VTQ84428.1 3-phosphoshikimate 1-carboxyvinyltransferase AroA [Hathewaya histolytica]
MATLRIEPNFLKGDVSIPPSKSLSHRAIICAALGQGESVISNVLLSEDIKATIEGMRTIGATIKIVDEDDKMKTLVINGCCSKNFDEVIINCRESGSTLRFLIPIALLKSNKSEFYGSGKLVERPLTTYYNIFKEKGIRYENHNGKLPLTIEGKLVGGNFEVEGNISSQFISGLLFALPLLEEDSIIKIKNNLESKAYVDLTIDMMRNFGIVIENRSYKVFYIKGNQRYKSFDYKVEGDFSQGAFFLVGKALGNEIKVEGLNLNSLQGDKEIIEVIKTIENKKSRDTLIDASEIPDLVPIIAVLSSLRLGKTHIFNAGRLRIKESDRLRAICTELKALGANIEELDEGLIILGTEELQGGVEVHSWNDHRIAMSLAIAGTRCREAIILKGSESVNKSYPHFWNTYKELGGILHEWSNRE